MMGLTFRYKGYRYIGEAVLLEMEVEDMRVKITKDIYPVLARRYHVTQESVEKSIREAVSRCWKTNPDLIEKLAGYTMKKCPSNREFIDILACYICFGTRW